MTYNETAVAIFCKAPIPGNVKTRLAADLGAESAAHLYRYCSEHCIWNVRHAGLDSVVYIDIPETLPAFHDWVGGRIAVQQGEGLGEKMRNAITELLHEGFERVMIVGTDVPFLDPENIKEASTALMTHDVVIGPAFDGGYYLIGTNADRPELFENISWSTSEVFAQTMKICADHGWSVAEMDPMRDIDTKDDLLAAIKEAPQGHDDFLRRCHLILHHEITG